MRRLTTLARVLLVDWLRNREAVFFALIFPLLLLVIFSSVFAGGPTEFGLGVQNNDVDADGEPTALSEAFVTTLEDAPPLGVGQIDPDTSLSKEDSIEEVTGYNRVLVIPDGFDQRVRAASARVRMEIIEDSIDQFGGEIPQQQRQEIENALGGFEETGTDSGSVGIVLLTVPDDEGAGAVESILESVVARFNDRSVGIEEPPVVVSAKQRGAANFGAADYFLPAFIVAMILINGVMTVPSAVAEFKRDGTLKRLAASPLRKSEWILANVVQQSILAVAITGVMILVAWVLFGVTAVPGPFALGLILLGAVAFTSLGMTVGGIVQDPGSAISLGGAIALPLMFVSGIFWELDLMPPTLQTVAELSPVTHFHRSLRQLLIVDSTSGVAPAAALLAILSVLFTFGAVLTTSWQDF